MDKIIKYIKKTIKEEANINNLEIKKIILFGSRARGDNSKYSDYDILIILNNDIERADKYKLSTCINKKTAKFFIENNILGGIDIIIKSINEIEYLKDKIGSVTGEAVREGVML